MTRIQPELDELTDAQIDALAATLDAAPRDAGDDKLLAALHDLPRLGKQPTWTDLERDIRRAVDSQSRLRAWWHSRWATIVRIGVPIGVAAAIALLFIVQRAPHPASSITPTVATVSAASISPASTTDAAAVPSLWLNGSEVDLSGIDDDDAEDLLDSLDDPPAPRPSVRHHEHHDEHGPEVASDMLRSMDLTWVDHLDDKQLDTLDSYLAHQPG